MPAVLAGVLVFASSAAILILEILAARLLAPYVGVSLETYSGIIGIVLAGITAGTWGGGWLSDRVDARRLLGPELAGGGLLAGAAVPVVRGVGDVATVGGTGGAGAVVLLAFLGFFAPAALLSAVTPTVVKLRLRDLAATGRVVGQLSALGTAGAITGTFLAGFVLIEWVATSTTIVAISAAFVVAGLVLTLTFGRSGTVAAVLAVVGALAIGLSTISEGECDAETTYHCAQILQDPTRPGGRLLVLDMLHHSYVDLDDPTYLEFRYTNAFAAVIDATIPRSDERIEVLHIGGGGFTMPRYLAATRLDARSTVLELDGRLVELVRERLGLETGPGMDVRVGDARIAIENVPPRSQHVVVGDAFGGRAVPWHLTTIEFVRQVRGVLRDDGVYVLNVIDDPPLRFARAEAATLAAVFEHVAVVAPADTIAGRSGGNVVLVGSGVPIPLARIEAEIEQRDGWGEVIGGSAAVRFAGDAVVLDDDHAPVDQWLSRAR